MVKLIAIRWISFKSRNMLKLWLQEESLKYGRRLFKTGQISTKCSENLKVINKMKPLQVPAQVELLVIRAQIIKMARFQ